MSMAGRYRLKVKLSWNEPRTAFAVALDSARGGDFVAIPEPMLQGLVHGSEYSLALLCLHEVEDRFPCLCAMISFHLPVGLGERQALDRHTVVLDQGMFFEWQQRRLHADRVDCSALVLRSLDEYRNHRRSGFPAAPLSRIV